MSFGSYPQVGLRDARERRDEARALIAQGYNPCKQRKQQRVAVRLANDQTFDAVFEQWIAFRKLSLKEGRQSTLSQILRIFAKDIQPYIGEQSIHEINRHVLMDLLSRIESRKAYTTAEKCRTWLNQLFRYALVRIAGLEHNPAADLDVVAVPKPPVEHNPFLRMEELPHFLGKLRAFRGSQQTQLGIRLLLLTGVRTGELRLATPDQFDLERRLWIIPPEVVKQLQLKMRKTRRQTAKVPPYIVPLSIQATEVVRLLLDQVVPAQRHLLTHRSDLSQRISENTLNGALRRMGFADRLTGHGVRATISTALVREAGPKFKQRRPHRYRSSGAEALIAENQLKRNFKVSVLNETWRGGVTYIQVGRRWSWAEAMDGPAGQPNCGTKPLLSGPALSRSLGKRPYAIGAQSDLRISTCHATRWFRRLRVMALIWFSA
ncbi:putative prophage CPS-53 integrase [compost metagenome]